MALVPGSDPNEGPSLWEAEGTECNTISPNSLEMKLVTIITPCQHASPPLTHSSLADPAGVRYDHIWMGS